MNTTAMQERVQAERIESLDILRVLSAVAIIWIHTPEFKNLQATTNWCRFAVPSFTCASVPLLILNLQKRPA